MAAKSERSLGWLPLVVMTAGYVVCTYFQDTIGPLTSAPGFYRISEHTPPPLRGCVIPRASP
ncbi:MAG: hypothetical protein Q8S73_20485 [Deltaproteobacteria bacterium]|nr:hypothetical protein [Myxococcales bacterium]MDP3216498.1 hypothetical protein [Deltaproteobacteria bacterium]